MSDQKPAEKDNSNQSTLKDNETNLALISADILQITELRRETLVFFGALIAGFAVSLRMVLTHSVTGELVESFRGNLQLTVFFLAAVSGLILVRFSYMFFEFCRQGLLYAKACQQDSSNFAITVASCRRFPTYGIAACSVYLSLFIFITVCFCVMITWGVPLPVCIVASVLLAVVIVAIVRFVHSLAISSGDLIEIGECQNADAVIQAHHMGSLEATRKDLLALTGFLALLLFATLQCIHDFQSDKVTAWLLEPVFVLSSSLNQPEPTPEQVLTVGEAIALAFASSLFLTSVLTILMYCHLAGWETKHLKELGRRIPTIEWFFSYVPVGFLLCWLFAVASAYILYTELPRLWWSILFPVLSWCYPPVVAFMKMTQSNKVSGETK